MRTFWWTSLTKIISLIQNKTISTMFFMIISTIFFYRYHHRWIRSYALHVGGCFTDFPCNTKRQALINLSSSSPRCLSAFLLSVSVRSWYIFVQWNDVTERISKENKFWINSELQFVFGNSQVNKLISKVLPGKLASASACICSVPLTLHIHPYALHYANPFPLPLRLRCTSQM